MVFYFYSSWIELSLQRYDLEDSMAYFSIGINLDTRDRIDLENDILIDYLGEIRIFGLDESKK